MIGDKTGLSMLRGERQAQPPSRREGGSTKVASGCNRLATRRGLLQTIETVSGEMGLDRGGRIILPEFGFTGWGKGTLAVIGLPVTPPWSCLALRLIVA